MNTKQVLGIISSVNGGLITGAALLQTLFGQDLTIKIVAVLGIAQIIVSSVTTQLSSQSNLVKDVAAMPGVEKVTVNASANSILATLAVDPKQDKVAPTTAAMVAVENTAKGA